VVEKCRRVRPTVKKVVLFMNKSSVSFLGFFTKGFLVFSLLTFLIGCNSEAKPDPQEKMPGIEIPLGSMNQKVAIIRYTTQNPLKIDDAVGFIVRNISNKKITFNEKYAYRLFVEENGKWKQIIDNATQFDEDIKLTPKETNTSVVYPEVSQYKRKVLIRLVVIAREIDDSNTPGDTTYAFTDFFMEP
jgi:hypothetical protein